MRLTVPRRGGWRAWGRVRADFERGLADPADPAIASAQIASELRSGADYVRVIVAVTVAAADVADALAIAWEAFRGAAGDDLTGWEVAAAAAEVQPEPPLTSAGGHTERRWWPSACGHAASARGTRPPSRFIRAAIASMSPGCGSLRVSVAGLWRVCSWVRLPFRRVLSCEIGTAEGKPQVEQYGLDELAASAEAVLAGLGPLAAGLARLAVEAGGAVTLDAMEVLVTGRGRDLLRGVVQLGLDTQAEQEVRLAEVTGADGVPRARAERGHARPVVTRLGEVVVRRIAYRSGIKGAGSLFPRDAVLNLPPCGYSWALQRLAEMFILSGAYEQAREFVLAATGVSIGGRQLEQIAAAAAADAQRFCQDRAPVPLPGTGQDGDLPPLAISADGKGVAMRPEARRRTGKAPGERVRTFSKRAGTGEKKGCKRMAETGCVFDVVPPRAAADAGAGHGPGSRRPRGRAPVGEPLVHLRYHR